MHIAFTGGGTGGHIYPCLAIAELINYENKHTESALNAMYYLGNADRLEEHLVSRKDYIQFLDVQAPRLPSKKAGFSEQLGFFNTFYQSCKTSINYIKENKIDVVMGTGGYVAAPVFLACILTKTPFLIHNLDSCFGLVNKVFRSFATKVTLGFPVKLAMDHKYKYTGNPVSHDFVRVYQELDPAELLKEKKQKDKFFMGELEKNEFSNTIAKRKMQKMLNEHHIKILVTGGSQGSQFINDCIGHLIKSFSDLNEQIKLFGKKITITHITGSNLYKEHVDYYLDGDLKKYPNYKVLPYSHDMADLCRDADITICRAGAMTCAEMAMSQCIPIFFPLPWAANNHQMKNAIALSNFNCAYIIQQDQENTQKRYSDLFDLINYLSKEQGHLIQKKKKLRRFSKPLATRQILDELKHILETHQLRSQ